MRDGVAILRPSAANCSAFLQTLTWFAASILFPVDNYAQIADKIRPAIAKFEAAVPAILEIPSKEHPYDPSKDSILQRVRGMLGTG